MRARAHPTRLRMLSLLTGAPMNAAELARELDLTQANASYHLRVLAGAGLVSLVGEEKVRGGTAKRYRYNLDAPASRDTEAEAESSYAAALGAELLRRSELRRPDGSGTSADAELWLPPQVWEEACAHVRQVMREIHQRAQPPGRAGATRVSVTVAMFEMTPPGLR